MKTLLHSLFIIVYLAFSQWCWAENILRMSTTTSTENSGLLGVLNSAFEKKFNIKIHVIPVGTGKALKIGSNGDVDIVFVHAPAAELEYVKQGDFINRSAVMHNDFVVVGPKNDPAGIASTKTITEAFTKISANSSPFISRGDDSGTHKKEIQLWKNAEIKPTGKWYLAVGQGMGAVLKMANDKQAYTLTDRGTLLAYSDKITLTVLSEGDSLLYNPYHVMAVNPKKHPAVHYAFAQKYINFLIGNEGQSIIKNFRLKGLLLFYPDTINDSPKK
ncbi:MAG: substrate-binding domain-containing protein [Methylococcaceae bacterium]|nr:substrate-binding domain-containing protein [Methylococcaceae bacterium]